ncbi:hypothetical protein SAMN05216544_1788 [Lachnospira pectinoschiza]|uniref:LysR substrate binding domain n=2 Tax=Lachnospira pectinoschiza TaxID=28052 RepID=A0A1G9YD46_9FIRM|nr:hypothetical protein SAMN05216544_1788 [Lachnospira pectinoschiza]
MTACQKDGYKAKIKKEVDNLDELILLVVLGEASAIAGSKLIKEKGIVAVPINKTHHNPSYVLAYQENHISNLGTKFLSYIKDYFGTL